MNYEQISDKEFNERMLLPAGDYAYEVLNAVEGVSKNSGADMITLELLVHSDSGTRKVKSYLVGSDKGKFQVRAFCESAGILESYKAGTFCADSCLGRSGWLRLRIETGRPKDDGSGNWPDKNTVGTFLANPPAKSAAASPAQSLPQGATASGGGASGAPGINDEDVPFAPCIQ